MNPSFGYNVHKKEILLIPVLFSNQKCVNPTPFYSPRPLPPSADQSMGEDKPLKKMAAAFKDLADRLSRYPEGEEAQLELAPFSHACSLVSPLFRCLGIAFKFAELDYVAKVNDLVEASKSVSVIPVMMEDDVKSECARKAGSHTRNLLIVKRGIDMLKVMFEHIVASEDNSLKDPATKAYTQVFAPYHPLPLRKASFTGMYTLPTKAQMLHKLNEDETSAKIQMQNYIEAAVPVVKYIEQLFISRGLGTDW